MGPYSLFCQLPNAFFLLRVIATMLFLHNTTQKQFFFCKSTLWCFYTLWTCVSSLTNTQQHSTTVNIWNFPQTFCLWAHISLFLQGGHWVWNGTGRRFGVTFPACFYASYLSVPVCAMVPVQRWAHGNGAKAAGGPAAWQTHCLQWGTGLWTCAHGPWLRLGLEFVLGKPKSSGSTHIWRISQDLSPIKQCVVSPSS